MIDVLKDRVVAATSSLFSHGPRPLEHTLDHAPDPGLLGPESVSWRVIGDAAAFVGGIRALLIQTADPEVAFRPHALSAHEADQFVVEQARMGALLGATPLPTSAAALARWVAEHPAVERSDNQLRATAFLRNPPLSIPVRVGVGGLRWMLGSSPSWDVALVRTGAPVPEGVFRQPLPAPVSAYAGGS